MTRCLDCGSERTSISARPAVSLPRPRNWWCGGGWCAEPQFFLVGIIVFVGASQVFPPLELDSILIFGGLVFFLSLALGYWIDFRARKRQEIEVMKRIYFGMIPVPWIFAGLLFLNGKLDTSRPIRIPATVVGKFATGGLPRSRRLVVTSWRYGRAIERIAVDQNDFDRFQPGDDIMIQMQKGEFSVPWVYGVFRE